MPVAVKTIVLPVNPAAVATSEFVPMMVPSVQRSTVAIPELDVVGVAPMIDPPPLAIAKVTVTPATPLPFASVTLTDGAMETGLPAVAC